MGVWVQLWRPQVGYAGEGAEFRRERSSWLLSGVEQESFSVRASGFTRLLDVPEEIVAWRVCLGAGWGFLRAPLGLTDRTGAPG